MSEREPEHRWGNVPGLQDRLREVNRHRFAGRDHWASIDVGSSLRFYLHENIPDELAQHWTVWAQERFGYLANHPNRVGNPGEADLIVPRLSEAHPEDYPVYGVPSLAFIVPLNGLWDSPTRDSDDQWIWNADWQHLVAEDQARSRLRARERLVRRVAAEHPSTPILLFGACSVTAPVLQTANVVRAAWDWGRGPSFRPELDVVLPPPLSTSLDRDNRRVFAAKEPGPGRPGRHRGYRDVDREMTSLLECVERNLKSQESGRSHEPTAASKPGRAATPAAAESWEQGPERLPLLLDSVLRKREDLVVEALDEELALHRTGSSLVLFLNPSATLIWRLCDGERTVREIHRVLEAAYPEEGARLSKQVPAAVEELVREGVLEAGGRD